MMTLQKSLGAGTLTVQLPCNYVHGSKRPSMFIFGFRLNCVLKSCDHKSCYKEASVLVEHDPKVWISVIRLCIFNVNFYEGCSNMNASSFITFVKYMLRQNDIRFYKGLYVTFKLAPDLKKNTVYLLSYSPLNEDYFCILTNSMLRTYQ